jgi:hypothetical protein
MAVFYTLTSMTTPYQMGHDQTYLGTFLAKDQDPTLYLRDYAFHDDTLYRSYIPSYRWFLNTLIRLTGSFESALLSLVPVVVFLFALGTGLLLLEWSRSVWIALVITFLAIAYRAAPSGEIWGVGGVEFLLPRTVATAIAPFIFILFFRFVDQPTTKKAVFTGISTGLLAFIHPPTAMLLGELFAGFFILNHFQTRRGWLFLALFLAGYFLSTLYPLTVMGHQVATPAASIDFSSMRQVIVLFEKYPTNWGTFKHPTERRVWIFILATIFLGLNYLLRPKNRHQAALQGWCAGNLIILYLCWRIAGKGADFTWLYLVAAGYVIWRYRQQNLEKEDWWLLGLGFVVVAISLLPYYFMTMLWFKIDSFWLTTLVLNNYRAVRLIHPFFYLFSARAASCLIPQVAARLQSTPFIILAEYALLALTMFSRLLFGLSLAVIIFRHGWRLLPQWRRVMSTGLTILLLITISGLIFFPAAQQSLGTLAVQDLGLRKSLPDLPADEELYTWARTQTPKDTLFFYGSPLFRYRSQRSITHALDLLNHSDSRYVEIYRRYNRLEKAYEDPASLVQEARALQADYLIVEKNRHGRLPLPLRFENNKYLVYQLANKVPENVPPPRSNRSSDLNRETCAAG